MEKNIKDTIIGLLPYVIVILIALFIKIFIVSPIRVNGVSMNNTLNDGDIMILNKITPRFSEYKRFEIVVAKYKDEHIIKRVVGLPGEEVEYKNNLLYINGKRVKYTYKHGKTDDFSYQLKSDEYFLMGDNRENSMDSRMIGGFTKNKIEGKTSLTIFPFKRIGKKY